MEEKYTVANMTEDSLKKITKLEKDLTGESNQPIVLIAYQGNADNGSSQKM